MRIAERHRTGHFAKHVGAWHPHVKENQSGGRRKLAAELTYACAGACVWCEDGCHGGHVGVHPYQVRGLLPSRVLDARRPCGHRLRQPGARAKTSPRRRSRKPTTNGRSSPPMTSPGHGCAGWRSIWRSGRSGDQRVKPRQSSDCSQTFARSTRIRASVSLPSGPPSMPFRPGSEQWWRCAISKTRASLRSRTSSKSR